jgi:hypothetical protein
MKNRIPFAALTGAFTIAGACVAYAFKDAIEVGIVAVALVAFIGGAAAAFSGETL